MGGKSVSFVLTRFQEQVLLDKEYLVEIVIKNCLVSQVINKNMESKQEKCRKCNKMITVANIARHQQ